MKRRKASATTATTNLSIPSWSDHLVGVELGHVDARTPGTGQQRSTARLVGGLTPGAERSADALAECANQIATGKTLLEELLSEWEGRIEADPSVCRALKDLNRQLRRELAALVLDTCTDFEIYSGRKSTLTRLGKLSKEADRRSRQLMGKARTAKKALIEFQEYASDLDSELGGIGTRIASDCLEQIGRFDEPLPSKRWRELYSDLLADSATHPAPGDPTSQDMSRLYWFFRHGCRLTGDEAEVRTGLIRNAFWAEWVKSVNVRLEYADGESSGCSAVHVAALRFKS